MPAPDDSLLAEALAACRLDGAVPVDEAFLDATPLITEGALRSANPFEAGVREAGRRLGAGRRIVFDLDDTLLNTDFTAKDGWFPDPLENAPGVDAWRYAAMRRDPWRTLRNGWRLPRRYSYSPRTYPFLGNPRVRAQWRPGVFAFLTGLREGGAELYLASATARARWRYLGTRFPLLNALFPDGHAACAEDLLAAALKADSAQADAAAAGGFFYGKTPGLLRRVFGIEDFDTLIDDSAYVARAYAALGAENSVLHVPPGDPHGDAVARIAAELAHRFASKDAAAAASSALTGGEVKPLAVHRFEDPFYYPTLHIPERHDRVAEAFGAGRTGSEGQGPR